MTTTVQCRDHDESSRRPIVRSERSNWFK